MNSKTAKKINRIAVWGFFVASLLTLNALPNSIAAHALGIAFMIAFLYGVVATNKTKKFIVDQS